LDDVEVAFLRAYGKRAITAKDLVTLKNSFETLLIPMAHRAGAVPAKVGFDALVALYRPDDPDFGTHSASSAQSIATDNLITAAAWLSFANGLRVEIKPAETGPDDLDWREVAGGAASLATHTYGYLSALIDTRNDTSRKGANGRWLIGATVREKVRKEAAQFRGKGSKGRAAEAIAEIVGKSPDQVRRMLTGMLPGDAWETEEHDDKSTDMTNRIDG